jgi:hypothetical protein
MGHDHDHHHHHHDHPAAGPADLPAALDPAVPDSELSPSELSRRGFLRGAGLLGAGAAAATVAGVTGTGTPAMATTPGAPRGGFRWLAGDHHIHTQYSPDAMFRVIDQAKHARAYGLDWMVITDHGNATHARIGVDLTYPDVVAAREEYRDLLIYQGLEWNIPAAEHGTVFVHPGRNELAVLKEFENAYDGTVTGTVDGTPANEALAITAINFLGDAVRRRRIADALFLANHPARRGVDSPHEIRAWRDADPRIAIGMEGAPGHQAAGIPAPHGPASGRGFYNGSPSANSFPGYPLESYRTWGGFDWMTATVGGLWDSLLAEGKPWWISASSDAHFIYLSTTDRGPGGNFDANGFHNDPVHTGVPQTTAGDFWPGYYSRTHVGATGVSYAAVMSGLRAGRVWVDHGGLIRALDVRVREAGDRRHDRGTPLGGVASPRRGTRLELTIDIDLATTPNWAAFVPVLARVDVIVGRVTGPVDDPDTFTTPETRVVQAFEMGAGEDGKVSLTYPLGRADEPYYVRIRGTDGLRSAPGLLGAEVDPHGPAMDVVGNANPWGDLWFYANPIFVLPRR